MVREWSNRNELNSFNKWKNLCYYEYYLRIDEWRLHKVDKPYPPIEISLDPIARCQCNCRHCNYGKYFDVDIGSRRMADKHIIDLLKFFSEWEIDGKKVKAICFGGGGEPSLHTFLPDALFLSKQLGIENSIATNGINFYDKLIKISSATCRWIGISVDAATEKTYEIGKGGNYFKKVLENIKKLVDEVNKNKYNNDIAYKFLIADYNQHEIYEACKIAKDLGVKDFYARICDLSHQGVKDKKMKSNYNIELILEQFEKCHQLEDENFRVFTTIHKFDEKFKPLRNFTQCYGSALCLQLNPNYNCYLCPDVRNLEFFKLGEHHNVSNIAKFWGSEKHYKLVFEEAASNCNWRCTFVWINYFCEKLAIEKNDPFCINFV